MFPTIFQSLMGLRKSRCDIPIGTTQSWAYLANSFAKSLCCFYFEVCCCYK